MDYIVKLIQMNFAKVFHVSHEIFVQNLHDKLVYVQ